MPEKGPLSAIDFQLLAESGPDTIVHYGLDMQVTYISRSSLQLFGLAPAEIIGSGAAKLVLPEDIPKLREACEQILTGSKPNLNVTFRARHANGEIVWVEVHGAIVRDQVNKTPTGVILSLRDVTAHRQMERRLSQLAHTDGLTGLANRRAFDEALGHAWQEMLVSGSQMSLLLFDLDHFKGFNDKYGHQVGDDCLRTVATTLANTLAQSDYKSSGLASRYGGEELAVILPGADSNRAKTFSLDILRCIRDLRIPHFANTDGGGWVTLSIGAATALCRAGGTIMLSHGLLTAADVALYQAKTQGRNQVVETMLLADASSQRTT